MMSRDCFSPWKGSVLRNDVGRAVFRAKSGKPQAERHTISRTGIPDVKMQAVEEKLPERAQWTSDDKYFRQAYRVYMNLIWLNGEVGPGAGDVAGGADFRPTDTSLELLAQIEKDLASTKAEYEALLATEVAAFNKQLSPNNGLGVR